MSFCYGNGKYPPNSLYHIMSGLLRYLRDENINDKNFLDQSNHRFFYLNKVLNSEMKTLTSEGLALPQRETLPVTETDERQILEKGVFGDFDAISLQRKMFFYKCKIFRLRAADEHRDLTTDQFTTGEEDGNGLYVDFNGKTSKTYSGSVKQRKLESKQIGHYDNGSGLVKLYEMYLSCVKTECENKTFNKSALPRIGENKFRFSENFVGINKLRSFMKEICKAAGHDGRYTNHSGKKTCVTSLYPKRIQEQEIIRRTGHRSIAGVRKYQKASNEMLKDVSNILNPKVSFKGGARHICPPKLDVKELKPKVDETDTKPDVSVSSELFKSNTSA